MTALLDQSNVTLPQFEEGDAGIILKANGSFVVWNTHKNINPETMTEKELWQGKALMAFAAALKIPQIMDVLMQVATDPQVFDQVISTGVKH